MKWLLRTAPIGLLLLAGCANFPGPVQDISAQKLKLMQAVLDKTSDGTVGYWRIDDQNFGLVAIDSTYRKGTVTCRVAREDEVRSGRSSNIVASYCKEPKGTWQ